MPRKQKSYGIEEIRDNMIKVVRPTTEIHLPQELIYRAKQDKLGRVYIWLEKSV